MDPFWTALGLTVFSGAATLLGGGLAVMGRAPSGRGLALALGLASGVMLTVSAVEMVPGAAADLAPAGGPAAVVGAFAAGAAATVLLSRVLPSTPAARGPRPPAGGLEEARLHRLGLVTALAIGLHNVPEGFVTFAGTLQDPRVGVALAVAMAVHNIPEGVAVAVPVRQATGSRTKAFGWAAFTGATEPVGALALWLLLTPFLTPVLLGAVYAGIAGVMTAVSLAGLLPAARAAGGWRPTLAGATVGALVMAASLWMLG